MDQSLLSLCRAHLVARTGPQATSLQTIAARFGFGDIQSVFSRRSYTPADDAKVSFFLVHRHFKPGLMEAVLRSVRSSPDDQVRLAPVILFTDDVPFETYLDYIHLGFDDVIALPEKQPILVQRLISQLGVEHTYFETADYFGPDRRRMEMKDHADSRRLAQPHSHTRYIFRREPGVGIRVVRTERHEPITVRRRAI